MEQQRQQAQQNFVESEENIEVGSLQGFPLTLQQLKNTTSDSKYVVKTFTSGLTAIVYHLQLGGQSWTLKLKRAVSLVNNIDGQTSFLNEVQRRRDLVKLKQEAPDKFKHIVDTQFANFKEGIILSPWIEGEPLLHLTRDIFEQIFSTIDNLELSGLFEWDFSSGNILLDTHGEIKLFDFGYMYRFDPKQHFNSNGLTAPLFHGVERFETRFFFDYLLKNPLNLSSDALFELYRIEKQCALKAYQIKLTNLIELGANDEVIARQRAMNHCWQEALLSDNALQELYLLESFRSNLLDLLDDLHGQSCTPDTLRKADLVLNIIELHYQDIVASDGFFFGDEDLSKTELIEKYNRYRKKAKHFQLV
ncbi:hypothetical protein [Psychromonas hadalis]|uniref:hypothetical protein n=1 Tax=Psychromonas hadalis TaxID=211669 RepID=UPI0004097F8F|nr:hypothetical protein [Psychromonas hadalis]